MRAEAFSYPSKTHLPEVVTSNPGFVRGARDTPQPGRRPLSSGPPTWEKHDTLWRLVYRRIEL